MKTQTRLGRQLADHVVSDTAMRPPCGRCPVRLPPEPLERRESSVQSREVVHSRVMPCRRHNPALPVLAEQPGVLATLSRWRSWVQIPSGTLAIMRRGTPIGRAAKLKPWCLWVRLPPVLLKQHASAGHWRAHGAVTPTPLAVQVQLLSDALDNTARSSSGSGCWTLDPVTRVQIPYGLLNMARWWNW